MNLTQSHYLKQPLSDSATTINRTTTHIKILFCTFGAFITKQQNDLLLLLSDEAVHVYAAFTNNQCVGCILAVEEGELDDGILSDIQNGSRRPKGHLVPVLVANHLGLSEAAQQRSLRIMRIAVHPDLHSRGIGSEMLSKLLGLNEYEYYSSSFGATEELIRFWNNNEFVPIKLGSHKDQASGTYSVVMVHGQHGWIDDAKVFS